ncbi:MAG: cyclic nucleotide-binding domain-containing protein [Myxococcales bacterium]|nr:cyclic nucleotide-binding domain-containing protein [Myxococcales bacterium]
MEIKYWAGTDVGRKRTENEDNFLIDKRLRLFVVADGMGGHASGEIASAMAVHGIREVIDRERDIVDTYDDDDPKSHVEVCTLLEYAVHHTCAQIFQKARREPEKRGMGTTLVVLLFIGARGFIAYVGDSRIYLLRGGIVYQLTEDHSLRNELIRMGKITADEFESSPYANLKNAMTRAVGVYESVEVDTLDFDVIPGDSFLLCSDGLYEYLSDDDIANAIGLPEIRDVPGLLIDVANKRGGKDNITAVVVQVGGDEDDRDRAAELNFTLDTLKNVPLFRELSYQQLVRVMNLSKQSSLEPGQILFNEGDPGHELFVVLRGRVELSRDGVPVAEVAVGAHLGEMSLIDATNRSATAVALEPGKVLQIGRDDFYDVLRREPALAVKLLWSFVRVLAERLRQTTADLADAKTSAIPLPDLTDLAEEAARSSIHMLRSDLMDEDDEADALENRRTLVSGTVVAASPDAPTRAEPQAPPPEPAPTDARSGGDAPRLDPRRTMISTTTSEVGKRPEVPSERSTQPGGMDVPETIAARARSAPLPRKAASRPAMPGRSGVPSMVPRSSSNSIDTSHPGAPDRPRGEGAPGPIPRASSTPIDTGRTAVPPPINPAASSPIDVGVPPPIPASPSSPINTGYTVVPPGGTRPAPPPGAPSSIVPASSRPIATGETVVPPSARSTPVSSDAIPSGRATPVATGEAPSAPPFPVNTGETVVPPSASPRAPSGPTNLGHTVVPPGGMRPPSNPERVATVAAPRPRAASGPRSIDATMRPPGGVPVPMPPPTDPRRITQPLDPPPSPPPAGTTGEGTGKKRRRATLPQMPGAPPPGAVAAAAAATSAASPPTHHRETITMAVPPPPPESGAPRARKTQPSLPMEAPRGNTQPSPMGAPDRDAPQSPATRKVEAAPQATPRSAVGRGSDDRPRVGVPPAPKVSAPKVPPPPPTRPTADPAPAESDADDAPED